MASRSAAGLAKRGVFYAINGASPLARGLTYCLPLDGTVHTVRGPRPIAAPAHAWSPAPALGGMALNTATQGSDLNTGTTIQTWTTSTAGSVGMWAYPTHAYNDTNDEFLAGQNGGGNPGFDCRKYGPGGAYYWGWLGGSDWRVVVTTTAANWAQNQWQHFLLTWGPTGTTLYRNGVVLGTAAAPTPPTAAGNLYIGQGHSGSPSGNQFAGSLLSFSVWNRKLVQADAWTLFDPKTRWSQYSVLVTRAFRKSIAAGIVGRNVFVNQAVQVASNW